MLAKRGLYGTSGMPITSESALLKKTAAVKKIPTLKDGKVDKATWDAFISSAEADDKDAVARTKAFSERFGIKAHMLRSDDLAKTLSSPSAQMEQINAELGYLSYEMGLIYAKKYEEFLTLGYGEDKAMEMADEYITGMINEELKILKRKYPYSFNAEGAVYELLGASKDLQNAKRFIKPKVLKRINL